MSQNPSMSNSDALRDDSRLSQLMDINADAEQPWDAEDLAGMLRHELAVPLPLAFGILSAEVAHQLQQLRGQCPARMTLRELLLAPSPPVALLDLGKRFGKLCRRTPNMILPQPLAMLLYYATIMTALMRAGQRISSLSDADLLRGLKWCRRQAWIDEQIQHLIREGLAFLKRRIAGVGLKAC